MNNLPTVIYAKRQSTYTAVCFEDLDDTEITLDRMIDLALEYGAEDLSNANLTYYLTAEWHDDQGRVIREVDYNEYGKVIDESTYTYPEGEA